MSTSSHEIPHLHSALRLAEIERKQQQIALLLTERRLEGILLRDPINLAWLTAGAISSTAWSNVAVFVTHDARVVLTDNATASELFETCLAGLGFQLKERPWHQPLDELIHDISHGRRVGVVDAGRSTDLAEAMHALRLPLSPEEQQRMRRLGRDLAHAVEATARRLRPRSTELDVVGELMHRLSRRGIMPVTIQVCADSRRNRVRHRQPSAVEIQRSAVIYARGQRDGLHVATSRTVCFGPADQSLVAAYEAAVMVHATGMRFSQAGWALQETWQRVARLYEKTGHVNEWQLSPQGAVCGYDSCESLITPWSEFLLQPGMPIRWETSIGAAFVADTLLVSGHHFQCLTPLENWPKLRIKVKDLAMTRPGILQKSSTDDEPVDIDDPDTSAEALAWLAEDSSLSESMFE